MFVHAISSCIVLFIEKGFQVRVAHVCHIDERVGVGFDSTREAHDEVTFVDNADIAATENFELCLQSGNGEMYEVALLCQFLLHIQTYRFCSKRWAVSPVSHGRRARAGAERSIRRLHVSLCRHERRRQFQIRNRLYIGQSQFKLYGQTGGHWHRKAGALRNIDPQWVHGKICMHKSRKWRFI
jgi:hypothetical protein